jgi:pyocin large subunit-like protein
MRRIVLVGAASLLLAACGPQAAAPEAEARPAAEAAVEAAAAEPEAPKVDGKPMWSSNRNQTAEENAREAFDRNGAAFGAADLDDYVRKAHAFTASPPKGAETLKRANGDTLIYDPASNTFAVATRDGAPRTMFKPDTGAAYWTQQKEREAARAAKAKSSG